MYIYCIYVYIYMYVYKLHWSISYRKSQPMKKKIKLRHKNTLKRRISSRRDDAQIIQTGREIFNYLTRPQSTVCACARAARLFSKFILEKKKPTHEHKEVADEERQPRFRAHQHEGK